MSAAKVFGIPELLEAILLEVPPSARKIFNVDDLSQPTVQLYALKRVNPDFQAVIGDSKKLQEKMFLIRVGKTSVTETLLKDYAPVLWLFDFLRLEIQGAEQGDKRSPSMRIGASQQGALSEEAREAFERDDASWRNIEASIMEDTASLRITVSDGSIFWRSAAFTCRFRGNDTLGKVYDTLFKDPPPTKLTLWDLSKETGEMPTWGRMKTMQKEG